MPCQKHHPAQNHGGFTLVELMISILLAAIILLGVNKIFQVTAATACTEQALGSDFRLLRGTQTQLTNDFGGMMSSSTTPGLIINSSRVFCGIDFNSPTASAPLIYTDDGSAWGSDQTGQAASGASTNAPVAVANDVNHRTDVLAFFANGTFNRQTAEGYFNNSPNSLIGPFYQVKQQATQAFISYTIGWRYDAMGTNSWQCNPGAPSHYDHGSINVYNSKDQTAARTWILARQAILLTGTPTASTSYQLDQYGHKVDSLGITPVADENSVANPFYHPLQYDSSSHANGAPSASCVDVAGIDAGTMRQLIQLYELNEPGTTIPWPGWPASLSSSGIMSASNGQPAQHPAFWASENVPGYFQAYHMAGSPPVRVNAPTGQKDTNYQTSPLYNLGGLGYRFASAVSLGGGYWGQDMFSAGSGQSYQYRIAANINRASTNLLPGCSQFIVEYAGDYLTQDPATGATTANVPDGTLDFLVDDGNGGPPIPATTDGPGKSVQHIRWYGYPRYTGNYVQGSTPPAAITLNNGVVPVNYMLNPAGAVPIDQQAIFGSYATANNMMWYHFERPDTYGGSVQTWTDTTKTPPVVWYISGLASSVPSNTTHPNPIAWGSTGNSLNLNVDPTLGQPTNPQPYSDFPVGTSPTPYQHYVCGWSANETNVKYNGQTYNLMPKLIRITMQIDDPHGRAPGQVVELIYPVAP